MTETKQRERKMLNEYLTDEHTDGEGHIEINEDIEILRNTASLIKEDSEIDFECMKNEILELKEMESQSFTSQIYDFLALIPLLLLTKLIGRTPSQPIKLILPDHS